MSKSYRDVTEGAKPCPENFEIIVTVNPKRHKKRDLIQFIERGATVFRINGAFLTIENVKENIDYLRDAIGDRAKILIDLPGYKIRFLYLDKEIEFKANSPIEFKKEYFNYPEFFDSIDLGGRICVNNGFNKFTVSEKKDSSIICNPDSDGAIMKGKGLHISDSKFRPSECVLSSYDLKLLDFIKGCNVDYVGLSFVHDVDDLNYIADKLKSSKIKCVPKIESKESVNNLVGILENSEMVILDRGDLAGEIGIESVWGAQKKVIHLSRLLNCKIILATQLLPSMVNNPLPTIAEIDSLYELLNSGIDGVQLSEETSVGKYGERCVELISDSVRYFRKNSNAPGIKKGTIFWIMGLTSSGKTSIAKRVSDKLSKKNIPVFHYDGDEIRDMFGAGFGFSEGDRFRVVKNLAYLANKSADQGFNVLVSALTAHDDGRRHVRENVERLVTIFLKCSVEECARRDPKGLYEKAGKDAITTLVGVNTPYKEPEGADLVIDTEKESVDEASDKIIDFMLKKGLLVK